MGNELEAVRSCPSNDDTEPNQTEPNPFELINGLRNEANARTPKPNVIMKQNQTNDNCTDFELLDERRLVFVSLIGLFQSWRTVPSDALHSSLLLLPLKRQWIFQPSKYIHELQSHFTFQMYSFSDPEIIAFVEFLKRKDSQGLALWMMDDHYHICSHVDEDSIHPFWYFVSKTLSNLTDTVTGNRYNALHLHREFWGNTKGFINQFGADPSAIWNELTDLTMTFNAIQEILFQSNPTLNPIQTYKPTVSFIEIACFDDDESEHEKENWFVSECYDSYDGTITDEGNQSDDEIIQWSIDHFDCFLK